MGCDLSQSGAHCGRGLAWNGTVIFTKSGCSQSCYLRFRVSDPTFPSPCHLHRVKLVLLDTGPPEARGQKSYLSKEIASVTYNFGVLTILGIRGRIINIWGILLFTVIIHQCDPSIKAQCSYTTCQATNFSCYIVISRQPLISCQNTPLQSILRRSAPWSGFRHH